MVRAPDGTIWKIATSAKKDTGPATRQIDDIVLLLGVADVAATKQFYVERGLTVARSFGSKYVEFAAPASHIKLALYRRRALAKDAGVPPEGTGSHRIAITSDAGPFTDPDGFAWEAAPREAEDDRREGRNASWLSETPPPRAHEGPRRAPAARRPGRSRTRNEAAAKERVKELKRSPRASKADGERDVLEKISEMGDADRAMAERIHAIVKASAPDLTPRTWYGMPAYAKDGTIVCHFQPAQKFKTRYPTLGFSDKANLDDGTMWPVAYALTKLTKADEARIAALVKKAAG